MSNRTWRERFTLSSIVVIALVAILFDSTRSIAHARTFSEVTKPKPIFLGLPPHGLTRLVPGAPQLPQWTMTWSLNGANYSAVMVGTDPRSTNVTTAIPTYIVPIKMVYGPDNGNMTFDPKKDMTANGRTVIKDVVASPLFSTVLHWKQSGTDLGRTQYIDAYQRANFWSSVRKSNPNYHVLITFQSVLPEQTIYVDSSQGEVENLFGETAGTMDLNAFDGYVQGYVASLTSITPNELLIFITDNIYLTENDMYVGGYHTATAGAPSGQTYMYATYATKPGAFAQDVSALSHEVGEWMDDPFYGNLNLCGNDGHLEVGDPLENEPNYGDFPVTLRRHMYDMQDLVFLPYFGAPRNDSVNKLLDFLGNTKTAYCVLHSFTGYDGSFPEDGLTMDALGNLYGTTSNGGDFGSCSGVGCGTIFQLASNGTEEVWNFEGGTDGATPIGSLMSDATSSVYGTTVFGGGGNCSNGGGQGCGTIFEFNSGVKTIRYGFTGGIDGEWPLAGLIKDKSGNLYGTTSQGGGGSCYDGCGTVFKFAPDGGETVLYAFTGGDDGIWPSSELVADKAGNLRGVTFEGGLYSQGTVFALAPDGAETVLHSFAGYPNDGATPYGQLVMDKIGNLYGTTESGGASKLGVVFKLAPGGEVTLLHSFTGGRQDGAVPYGGLISDNAGNLYGSTSGGGESCTAYGCGVVFQLAQDGTETILHFFIGGSDGAYPFSVLRADENGNLYGTTTTGGSGCSGNTNGCGTVFRIIH